MLQQTTVGTVVKKFPLFIKKYPDFKSFTKSSEKELLVYWSGLGYYRRARNLWNAVNIINTAYQFKIPSEKNFLMNLPGVGSYTSSAIRTIGYNIPDTPVDINIQRLFSGLYGTNLSHKQIEEILEFIWPKNHSRDFTESLMDLASAIKNNNNLKVNDLDLKKYLFAKNQKKIYLMKTKKKIMKNLKIDFLIMKYKKQIAFLKKPNLSFFKGFEHLPNSKDLIVKEIIKMNKLKKTQVLKYIITNHNLQISIFEILLNFKNTNFKWYNSKELKDLPLPTLYKKILKLVS